ERDAIENRPHWSTATTSPLWHQFSARIKHVVFLQPKAMPAGFLAFAKNYKVVAAYAARNGMTINIAYLARVDGKRLKAVRQRRVHDLAEGVAAPRTLYVVADKKLWAR